MRYYSKNNEIFTTTLLNKPTLSSSSSSYRLLITLKPMKQKHPSTTLLVVHFTFMGICLCVCKLCYINKKSSNRYIQIV